MRILIITDAWFPQVNGVVRTMNAVVTELRRVGHEICMITPEAVSYTHLTLPTIYSV